MPSIDPLAIAEKAQNKLDHIAEQARLRAARNYAKNKARILETKKENYVSIKKTKQIPQPSPIIEPEVQLKQQTKKSGPQPEIEPHDPTKIDSRPAMHFNYTLKNIGDIYKRMNDLTLREEKRRNYLSWYRCNISWLHTDDLQETLQNADKVIAEYRQFPLKNSAKRSYIRAILFAHSFLQMPLLRSAKDKYVNYYNVLGMMSDEDAKNKNENEIPSPAKIIKSVIKCYGYMSKEYILTRLYEEVNARDDFYLELVDSIDKTLDNLNQNYLVVPPNVGDRLIVVLNKFKTVGIYHEKRYDLTAELSSEIRDYISDNQLQYHQHLFGKTKKLGPFIAGMLKTMGFKTDEGAMNFFRKSNLSALYADPNMTFDDKVEIACRFNHSTTRAQVYLRKISPDDAVVDEKPRKINKKIRIE